MTKLDDMPDKKVDHKTNSRKSELQGRGIIYIDTDDDVTSLIEKVKSDSNAVVALVPPKRVGLLQSVVNLKLIKRAAKLAGKQLSLVTTDPALVSLASGLSIPVAKTINSQAIVPKSSEDDDVSDVIEGSKLPISDFDDMNHNRTSEDKDISAAVAAIETDDKIKNDLDADGEPDNKPRKAKNSMHKRKTVPDFAAFRKKLLIIVGAIILVVGFAVWALVFAPSASIIIKAKTSSVDVTKQVTLIPSASVNTDNGVTSPVIKQKKSTETANFEATGSKETGDKAKGTVMLCYKKTAYNSKDGSKNQLSLPAGTKLYTSGVQFSTDGDVSVPGGLDDEDDSSCTTVVSVKVTAVNIGTDSNIDSNTVLSVAGYGNSTLSAQAKGDFTGGSKQTVKVVQQSDVDAAVAKLKNSLDTATAKKDLQSQMSSDVATIDDSFISQVSSGKSSPAVGETPSGSASVSVEVSYSLVGASKSDLGKIIDSELKNKSTQEDQKVYDNGIKQIKFSDFQTSRDGYTVKIATTGHVGPEISEDDIKKNAVGKKTEEVKANISNISGVSDVDVRLSPFWVGKVPAVNKIKVDFTIDE